MVEGFKHALGGINCFGIRVVQGQRVTLRRGLHEERSISVTS